MGLGSQQQDVPSVQEKAVDTDLSQAHASGQSGRITWIDTCKGICIILVVLGHINLIPGFLRAGIFSFHMPLFMILNGYLIHDYDVKRTFIRSLKSLMVPYVVVCLLEAVVAALFATDIDTAGAIFFCSLNDMIVGMSKTSTLFTEFGSVWLIWFVCCLFLSRNLYVLIRSACEKLPRAVQAVIVVSVAVLGCFVGEHIAFLPWSLDVALASVVFIAFGDFLRTHSFDRITKTVLVLAATVCWVLLLYNGAWIELATRSYRHGVLCFLCAFSGSIVVIAVSKWLERIPVVSYTTGFLSWVGKNSIVVLAIHCLEMRFVDWEQWQFDSLAPFPAWLLEFLVRISLILLATYAFTQFRRLTSLLNERLKSSASLKTPPSRLEWPDIAKGICIISVILGHQGIWWINQIVYVYDLPVFFILAGYFLHKKDGRLFAKQKAQRLLVPYAVTSAVLCLVEALKAWAKGSSLIQALLPMLDAALYGAGDTWETPFHINYIGGIWFLWALFFALIIANFFIETGHYQIILASIAFLGWFSFDATGVWLPLSIQAGMLACVYLLIGYECRKAGLTITDIPGIPLACLAVASALGIQHFTGIWLVHNYFGNGWFDFFITIAAGLVIITLSNHISRTSEWLTSVLSFFGKNSLVILCAHIVEGRVLHFGDMVRTAADSLLINNNHACLLSMFACIAFATLVAAALNGIKRLWGGGFGFANPQTN